MSPVGVAGWGDVCSPVVGGWSSLGSGLWPDWLAIVIVIAFMHVCCWKSGRFNHSGGSHTVKSDSWLILCLATRGTWDNFCDTQCLVGLQSRCSPCRWERGCWCELLAAATMFGVMLYVELPLSASVTLPLSGPAITVSLGTEGVNVLLSDTALFKWWQRFVVPWQNRSLSME